MKTITLSKNKVKQKPVVKDAKKSKSALSVKLSPNNSTIYTPNFFGVYAIF
jgi:hypothetical protein